MNIYNNLCLRRVSNKELKKIDNTLKFTTYSEWKQYIYNKYKDYDKEFLSEFSRYLNQGIRNMQPIREYSTLFFPIIIALATNELFKKALEINDILSDFSALVNIVIGLILIFILYGTFFYIILTISRPIWDNNIEENMYKDYKEIIDEMLTEKLNQ